MTHDVKYLFNKSHIKEEGYETAHDFFFDRCNGSKNDHSFAKKSVHT